jgi:hypothetical protein
VTLPAAFTKNWILMAVFGTAGPICTWWYVVIIVGQGVRIVFSNQSCRFHHCDLVYGERVTFMEREGHRSAFSGKRM